MVTSNYSHRYYKIAPPNLILSIVVYKVTSVVYSS